MTEVTKLTVQDCLQGAFQALLKGDTKTRDELCALAETAFEGNGAKQGMATGSIPGDTPVKIKGYIDN